MVTMILLLAVGTTGRDDKGSGGGNGDGDGGDCGSTVAGRDDNGSREGNSDGEGGGGVKVLFACRHADSHLDRCGGHILMLICVSLFHAHGATIIVCVFIYHYQHIFSLLN